MFNNRKVYAIIGAAGSGRRMAAPVPKQFMKIGGKTILEKTIERFEETGIIDGILIVTAADQMDECCRLFRERTDDPRIEFICGGSRRQDSIRNALLFLWEHENDRNSIVLIHDGVRPYASSELICRVAEETCRTGAAIAAVDPKDTIRHISDGTLRRDMLKCVQTPQGFTLSLIYDSFRKAYADGFEGTDDASIAEYAGNRVSIVDGEYSNIKITTPEDIPLENRIGTGYDVHKLAEGRKLIIGGVEIPYEKGLLGHSDADVLVHALMDAMLGACAMGDIGKLFPDSDDRYKGISSIELLREVTRRITEEGYRIVNADMTIICQKPKLADYIPLMREKIAEAANTDVSRISVKATTTEKLGFTGRGEGIAAEAVCLLSTK